jgi:hypothetical protein
VLLVHQQLGTGMQQAKEAAASNSQRCQGQLWMLQLQQGMLLR